MTVGYRLWTAGCGLESGYEREPASRGYSFLSGVRRLSSSLGPRRLAPYALPGFGYFAVLDAGGTNFTDSNAPVLHYPDLLEIG